MLFFASDFRDLLNAHLCIHEKLSKLHKDYLLTLGEVGPGANLQHNDDNQDHGDEAAENDPDHQGHCPRHPPVVFLRGRCRTGGHLVTEDVVLVVVALDALARGVVDGQDVPDVDFGRIVRENPGRI